MLVLGFFESLIGPVVVCALLLHKWGVFSEIKGNGERRLLLFVYSCAASFLLIYLIMFFCNAMDGGVLHEAVSRAGRVLWVLVGGWTMVLLASNKVRINALSKAEVFEAVKSNIFFFIFLVCLGGYELYVFKYSLVAMPHGGWDAVAIWNLKARFLFLGGRDWEIVFSPALVSSHLDYPLLLPFLVSYSWLHGGQILLVHSVLLHCFILAILLLSLFAFVAILSNQFLALVAASSVMLSGWFTHHASWQYVNSPLS